MKRIFTILLIAVVLLSASTAFASGTMTDTTLPPVSESTKADSLLAAVPFAKPGDEIGGLKIINATDSIRLAGGKSKQYNFTMNNLFGQPHNAFNVRITNVSTNSLYTLSITYDGVELWNRQYTGNAAVDVSNCSPNQKWTVLIINDSSQTMSCDVAITSYIE